MAISPRPTLSFIQALLAMLGISLVLMLAALDQTVIGNALPSIVADLNGFDFYAWVGTSYLLTSIITIPIFGRLGDYYGRKPFVVAATITFTVASLGCGMAHSIEQLILARALQGIGGGMLIGTTFACIPDLFPETRQRLRWQVMLSSAFSIVNALGPLLGGMLTSHYGWRSVFYLNVPLGGLALFFAWRFLPWFHPAESRPISLDVLGAMLIAVALGGIQLFVEWIPRSEQMMRTWGIGAISAIAIVGLVVWERRCRAPLMPPALFAKGGLRILFSVSVLVGAVMFALLFYMPLLFQGSYGYSPSDAGILMTPMVLSITVGAIINSRIIRYLKSPNTLPKAGLGALLLACVGLALCGRHAPFACLLGLMLMAGGGLGFILLNLTLFTQTLAEQRHMGIATALLQSLRLVGGLLGAAAMGASVTFFYRHALWQHASIPTAALDILHDPQALLKQVPAVVTAQAQEAARDALASAMSLGLGAAAVLIGLALWCFIRLPRVPLFDEKSD